MKLEALKQILGEARSVNYNGKFFSIGLNSSRDFKKVPSGGISRQYEKMDRFQTASLIYMTLQLRKFTDKGHGVYIHIRPEFRMDTLLPKAIHLSGREHLIKLIVCDSPELKNYRVNLSFDNLGEARYVNSLEIKDIMFGIKKFDNLSEIHEFYKTLDLIWNISTKEYSDAKVIKSYQNSDAKNIFVDLDEIKHLSKTSPKMEYGFASNIKAIKI